METLDFDQIALKAMTLRLGSDFTIPPGFLGTLQAGVAEQLRQVWNARGIVDAATIEAELARMMGGTASGPYVTNLERAIKAVDR